MKLQHAKHVIHQHTVLLEKKDELLKAIDKLTVEKRDLEKLPDKLRAETETDKARTQQIDEQIAILTVEKAGLSIAIARRTNDLKAAHQPAALKNDEIKVVVAGLTKLEAKLAPFTRELEAAKTRVAEIAALEAEREKAEEAAKANANEAAVS